MTEFVITGLVILLLGSNLFWGMCCHKLVNKIMSRSFYDYQQAAIVPKKQEADLAEILSNVKLPPDTHPGDADRLDKMIQGMGLLPLG